jgi:Response regulator containing CheY-like receiver, AAA-type ATPase, and DNA-binding domains
MINAGHILIADDDADFILLLKAAFEEAHANNPVHTVEDSSQAQKYLSNEVPYDDRVAFPVPGLIILDLRLPPKDAISLVGWIRQQPHLDGLPVVILTGAEFPNQEEVALHTGANGYFIKPFQFSQLVTLARHLRDTWLRHDETLAQHSKR